jgi:hypothetical protein
MSEPYATDKPYEVILGPAAIRIVLGLRDPDDRKELAYALRTELTGGPNADKELRFDSDGNAPDYVVPGLPSGHVYTAIPLSFNGYTALYRRLTEGELRRLRREQGRPVSRFGGFYVFDLLSAGSAFGRPRTL